MIKLQFLLCHPSLVPEADPGLRARLAAHGITVTEAGRASLSATVGEKEFECMFGPPQSEASTTARPFDPPALPVPADLADAISLITVAPRHTRMSPAER